MGTAKLVVTIAQGEKLLNEYLLTKDVTTIGRTQGNDVILPDPEKRVSSRHAQIERKGNAYFLSDLGSTNGTILNEKKIEPRQPTQIKNGDRISLGVFLLHFVEEVKAEAETADLTIVSSDPSRQAARLAEEAAMVYARNVSASPEIRRNAVKEVLKHALGTVPPETARAVYAQIRARFEQGLPAPGEKSTIVRKRDAEIKRQEELYQAGFKCMRELSAHYLGESEFQTAEQVQLFASLLQHSLNTTLQWLSAALKARRTFENEFSADLTMVFSREGNPIKTAAAPTDIGKFLLDWHTERNVEHSKTALEAAFKDLTLHQLGLLAGVQGALKAALGLIEPKVIEQQAGSGGVFSKSPNYKKAWEIYTTKHKEMFEENSKLFNEIIYPNIRKQYLSSHAPAMGSTVATGPGGSSSVSNVSKPGLSTAPGQPPASSSQPGVLPSPGSTPPKPS